MKRKTLFLVLAVLTTLPTVAFAAGLVPCGGSGEQACQLCYFVTLMENVFAWLVMILSIVVALIFITAGLRLVTSTGNVSEKEAAKKMINNAFIGFVIVLAAWLLVDFGMKTLLSGGNFAGPWNAIQCVPQPQSTLVAASRGLANGGTISESCTKTGTTFDCNAQVVSCATGGGNPYVDTSDPSEHKVNCTYSAAAYGGSCTAVADATNPCHASNLTMFGARADEASIICNKESGGAPIKSGSDLCCGTDGDCSGAPSFSGGYFQINVLAHGDKVPGCTPGTFYKANGTEGPQGDCVRRNKEGICTGWSCEITDVSMYNTCMKVTTDKQLNFDIAGKLYKSRGDGFGDWSWSAKRCSVPTNI